MGFTTIGIILALRYFTPWKLQNSISNEATNTKIFSFSPALYTDPPNTDVISICLLPLLLLNSLDKALYWPPFYPRYSYITVYSGNGDTSTKQFVLFVLRRRAVETCSVRGGLRYTPDRTISLPKKGRPSPMPTFLGSVEVASAFHGTLVYMGWQ